MTCRREPAREPETPYHGTVRMIEIQALLENRHGYCGRRRAAEMRGPTYPFELLNDAKTCAPGAGIHGKRLPQHPKPRGASVLPSRDFHRIQFPGKSADRAVQDHVTNGPGAGTPYGQTVLDDLRDGKASVSRTMKEWPINLVSKDVHGSHHFREFCVIRSLRNQLVHPKLEPLNPNELNQDQLLRRANCDEATWVLGQICIMAVALYKAFGVRPLPEAETEANAPRRGHGRLSFDAAASREDGAHGQN